jgi:Ser/Thr protein kinase RdoA (MazF antagonist)
MGDRVLLAQGRQAEVFGQPDGTVLKLLRRSSDEPQLRREIAALSALARQGLAAPVVLDVVTIDGRPGVVMERIAGTDLLELLARRPLSVLRAGRVIAEAHVAMHDCVAPADLPDLHDDVARQIELAEPLTSPMRAAALKLLAGLPHGDRLCHGDLHFGNMLGSWSASVVIDWATASRGDAIADVARTDLLLRFGAPPPGAPLLIRWLAPIFRGAVVSRYLATYRRLRPFDELTYEHWRTVRVAARLAETIPAEQPRLMAFLRPRLPTGD